MNMVCVLLWPLSLLVFWICGGGDGGGGDSGLLPINNTQYVYNHNYNNNYYYIDIIVIIIICIIIIIIITIVITIVIIIIFFIIIIIIIIINMRPPSFESSSVLCITPTYTSSMQELKMQEMQHKLEKSCFRCKKNTGHVESTYILQPPKYLIIVVNRFRYINNFTKDRCAIPMDMTVVLGHHKFSLQATIDHHGPSMYSGHYTASINFCKNNSIATTAENNGVWNDWYLKLLYCLCGNVWIYYMMVFELEQQDGNSNYSHGAGTSSPSH